MNKQWTQGLIAVFLLTSVAAAQTQVGLKTQSKSADLSNVGPTKPMQTGTSLPALCTTGQMFFLTTAAPGSNLFACTSTNVWSAIVGSGGGGGSSVAGGSGIVVTQSGGTATISTDPGTIPTKASVQATTANVVTLTSSSGIAVTGTQNPTLSAYADKQMVEFTWNVACVGGPMTLSIDSLAAASLVKADGSSTLSTADCPSGQTNLFTYDGTLGKFKLLAGGAGGGGGGTTAFTSFQGTTGNITMTGSDVVIYTLNAPALAAGACYRLELTILGASSAIVKIKIDGTTISTPWGSGSTAAILNSASLYCNSSGQTAQELVYPYSPNFMSSSTSASGWNVTTDGGVSTPTAFNWSSGHTFTITVNEASGTVQGGYFHVVQQ